MKMWKQGLSLLMAAFLMTSVLSPTAFADYFPKNDEKSNYASNIALIYTGYYNPDNYDGVKVGDYNKDQFLPYVGYLNEQGVAEDYFFDTFLMLTTQSPYKGSLARYYDWVAGSKPGTLQDWIWAMDRMFEKGLQLDGLEEAVEQVGADMNDPGKKVNVYLTMPFPDPQCKDFGDFNGDGQVKNLERLDTRKELIRWYIDTMTDRFNQRSYKHLKLSGFYWLQEDLDTGVPGEKESVQYTAEYLHQHNMRLGWIPLQDRQTENATFYIDDLKLVKYEGMKQAPDYAIKLPSAIPAMDVGAVWTPAVENKSEKDAQGQLVTVEAVFSSSEPSVIEITPEGTLKALQAGKAVIRAAVGNIEAESKVVEVSPWRFNQLKGADSIIEMDSGLKNPVICDPLQGGKQYVVKDGSNIKVAHKYNERYDMWLVFDHFGANKLHSFYEWRLSPNEGKEVSLDLNRASSVLQGEGSDWIGPYIVKANESGNANGQDFTGGNHNYDGGIHSSPTARTVQYKVWADGVEVKDGQVIPNSKVTIQVVNYIQGYNTKQQDGGGREILKETVTYDIAGGQVHVNNEIEALEDVTFYKYYGLQSVNGAWNDEIRYYAGDKLAARSSAAGYSDSGTKAEHPEVDKYVLRSGKQEAGQHHLLAWIDRDYGLGKLQYLADERPVVFTQDYGKTYFLQIVDTAPELRKGETFSWRGGYHFFSAPSNKKR